MNDRDIDAAAHQEAAAGWLARLRAPGSGDADRRDFEAWLDAQAGNRAAFHSVSAAWAAAEQVRDDDRVVALRQWALAEGSSARPGKRQIGGLKSIGAVAAAAACAALLLLPRADVDQLGPARQIAASAPSADIKRLETQVGQRASGKFADGSTITLNTNTIIHVPRWDEERVVELVQGEAHFAVAKDPDRPFSVIVAGKRVTALGTRFDVRLQDDDAVKVTLVEGRVRVETDRAPKDDAPAASSTEMAAGSQLIATSDGEWRLSKADTGRTTSWLQGQVIFDRDPLGHAVREMNRYSEIELRLVDARLASMPVSGVFHAGKIEEFAAALEAYGLVKIGRRLPGAIELRAPAKS